MGTAIVSSSNLRRTRPTPRRPSAFLVGCCSGSRVGLGGAYSLAANTGTPLDATGVEALSTLRASAKRGTASVGRFGVGFAAVLAVTDEPAIGSTTTRPCGGLGRYPRIEVADLRASPMSCRIRDGDVPALRLPFPATSLPGARRLRHRGRFSRSDDQDAEALTRQLLGSIDAALLLALPVLAEVTIEIDGVRPTARSVVGRRHRHADRRRCSHPLARRVQRGPGGTRPCSWIGPPKSVARPPGPWSGLLLTRRAASLRWTQSFTPLCPPTSRWICRRCSWRRSRSTRLAGTLRLVSCATS